MIHYWPAFIVLIIHVILGVLGWAWEDDSEDLIQDGPLTHPFTGIAIPLFGLPALLLTGGDGGSFHAFCILYGMWVVTDTSQRWAKSNEPCDSRIASSNSINPEFRRIFVAFVALASIFLSCGDDSNGFMPIVSLVIPILFMVSIGIARWIGIGDLSKFFDSPEQIMIAYVKGANEIVGWGWLVAVIRMLIVASVLLGSIGLAYTGQYYKAGKILAGILIFSPIIILLFFANKCLYKEADKEQSDPDGEWGSCKFAKYGGLRTYLAITWLCICAVIIKNTTIFHGMRAPDVGKGISVTGLIFVTGILSAIASVV